MAAAGFGAVLAVLFRRLLAANLKTSRAAKQRRQALAECGESCGLSFRPGPDNRFAGRCADLRCLQKGDKHYAYNIVEGTSNGRQVRPFDYHHENDPTSTPSLDPQNDFSAVIVTTNLALKPLLVRPRESLDKVAEFCSFDDVGFESIEFNRKFQVRSPDKRWGYDVVNQATMELLLAHPQFSLQFAGADVIAYYAGRFTTAGFDAALRVVEGIIDRLPPSLVRELRAARSDA